MIRTRPSTYIVEITEDDGFAAHVYRRMCDLDIAPVRPVYYQPGKFVAEVSAYDINELRKIIRSYEHPTRTTR